MQVHTCYLALKSLTAIGRGIQSTSLNYSNMYGALTQLFALPDPLSCLVMKRKYV